MKIFLGSSSPRRYSILKDFFNRIDVLIPEVDESPFKDETPEKYCLRIAKDKSDYLLPALSDKKEFLLITSDTTVACKNKIFGKPLDFEEALKMLKIFNSNKHSVYSAISIVYKNNSSLLSFVDVEKTDVLFKDNSDEILTQYLNSIKFIDKAGGYAVQENGNVIIDFVDGSISNVVGFPLRLFFRMLSRKNLLNLFLD